MIAHSAWRRHLLQAAAAGSIAALLAACGDTRPNVESVVSFGDSLSDLGTFQWGPQAAAGGGRYTTNAGTIWVEQVASAYARWLGSALRAMKLSVGDDEAAHHHAQALEILQEASDD